MKLFEVTNGYVGESYVKVYVICGTPEDALILAEKAYKKAVENSGYDETYWTGLKATEIVSDTSKPWCGEPRDY